MFGYESLVLYLRIVIMTVTIASSRAGKGWLNDMKDLSVITDGQTIMESYPRNEGFSVLSGKDKKSLSTTPTLTDSSTFIRTSLSKTTTTTNEISSSIDQLSRRLLNEPNDVQSEYTSIDHHRKMDHFLDIDDEKLLQQLVNIAVTVDGSGDTIEPTLETTTESATITTELTIISSSISTTSTSTPTPTDTVLSGYTTFLITVDCINTLSLLQNILDQFNRTFSYWYNVTYNDPPLACQRTSTIDIRFTFFTDRNITILTNLFQTFEKLVSQNGIELNSINACGTNETVLVKDVTSCYLINLCSLCGTNPPRGVCLPEKNVSQCQCFINENNPSISYVDKFCTVRKENGVTSTSPSWVPIVVGILGGIAGLFCALTSCLLIIFICRRRRSRKDTNSDQSDTQVSGIGDLSRARMPSIATANNTQNYLEHTSGTTDRRFSQEIDGSQGAFLTNLPSDIVSLASCYDPIVELDVIIDKEDVNLLFDQ